MSFAPAYPHDPIEPLEPDVFLVRGSIPLNPLMRISRNMVIVRHEGELSLVDPIRLGAEEEKRLDELGQVKRILRLGPMHGLDDPYYIDRYGAELWAPGSSEAYPEPKPDLVFDESTPAPFPNARFFCFVGTQQAEAALLLSRAPREGGLLVTCDSIQHYGDYRHNTLLARLLMPFIGFPKTTILGPIWVKLMTPEGGSLESEFRRLLELDFDRLVSAHGSVLAENAQDACRVAIDRKFS